MSDLFDLIVLIALLSEALERFDIEYIAIKRTKNNRPATKLWRLFQ